MGNNISINALFPPPPPPPVPDGANLSPIRLTCVHPCLVIYERQPKSWQARLNHVFAISVDFWLLKCLELKAKNYNIQELILNIYKLETIYIIQNQVHRVVFPLLMFCSCRRVQTLWKFIEQRFRGALKLFHSCCIVENNCCSNLKHSIVYDKIVLKKLSSICLLFFYKFILFTISI